jgi:hydrogenase expression/formation protein HypC
MCLAIPLRLVELNGKEAVAEANGVRRTIRVDFIREPKVGDYVIAHAGFAIERMNEQQALDNLRAIQEVADAL